MGWNQLRAQIDSLLRERNEVREGRANLNDKYLKFINTEQINISRFIVSFHNTHHHSTARGRGNIDYVPNVWSKGSSVLVRIFIPNICGPIFTSILHCLC